MITTLDKLLCTAAASLLLVAGHNSVRTQFVAPPTNFTEVLGYAGVPVRYKEVPVGICELDPNVKSYSGYADVGDDQHIFWWFFEARNQNAQDAPLTIWINGGPGASSMMGLFQELGPCGVSMSGHVYSNPYSWTNVSNMLFIDQPSQVGFSYSIPVPGYVNSDGDVNVLPNNTCPGQLDDGTIPQCGTFSKPMLNVTANSTITAAPSFWKTLQGFAGAFPQYTKKGWNLATESYGGHYGPVFGKYIKEQNHASQIANSTQIDLKTLLVGNGWFDPLIGFESYYNFTVYPGNTYDWAPLDDDRAMHYYDNLFGPGMCLDLLRRCLNEGSDEACSEADFYCSLAVQPMNGVRDDKDIRELNPDPFPYTFFASYLNRADVQQAIGAYTNWSQTSTVGLAFAQTGDDAREVDTIEDVRWLLEKNTTVALYYGDADYNCNWLGGEVVADRVMAPGFADAGYVDMKTSDGVVHGQTRQAGRFSFARVYESGHMVPFYQPILALELFERAIKGLDLETGTMNVLSSPGYLTFGPKKSTYREGNSTMQWEVVDADRTYDALTNKPGAPWGAEETVTRPDLDDDIIRPTLEDYYRQYPFQLREEDSISKLV